MNYSIPQETIEKIKDAAVLHDVISDFNHLKKKGSDLVGTCPYCHGKKFHVSPSKGIYKCFSGCEKGGNNSVQYLLDMQGMEFLEAIHHLAGRYNIPIEAQPARAKENNNRKEKFRNTQLRASGIPDKEQHWWLVQKDSAKVQMDRYQAASVDRAFNIIQGDDMVLHYLDLDGAPMTYQPPKGSRKALVRVRWANPDLHLSKDGKPMKYQSPYKSGSHLWIPNRILAAYKAQEMIETLYITEGEKKADKMCLEGMHTVGIMGINNFALNEMPRQFELLIKRCGIRRVVFLLDADWHDISISKDKPVDQRPKGFYKAVRKFRDYFYAYSSSGIYLDLFFSYGKNEAYKGADDLLVRGIDKGAELQLKDDFNAAFISRDGEGEYIKVHKITDMSDYQLKEFWHLHAAPAFMKAHEEQLKKLPAFTYNRLKWRWNEEEEQFELAQKILPHEQFWRKEVYETRSGKEVVKWHYVYQHMRVFLQNRGYGQYEFEFDRYRFVHIDGQVVKETSPSHIRRYVRDFVEDINEPEVLEMILRGGNAYMGSDKLADLYMRQLEFMEGDRDTMYMFFQDQYWEITAKGITSRPIQDIPRYVWENNLIRFSPKKFDTPMLEAHREDGNWTVQISEEGKKCDMLKFNINTSAFHWRKNYMLKEKDGKKFYVKRPDPEPLTDKDVKMQYDHFMAKVFATGYIMHDYLDYSIMKAIICMDGDESAVGRSQGGTGKSIWSNQFDHLMAMEIIDGKSKTIEEDKHVYELVDERTRVITFDDVRVNFNFEWLFSQITRGIVVNPKGQRRMRLNPPKFIVNTNHAINGEGNSFKRRQYMIGFADYYNEFRTPHDEFGYQLFHDWDYEEWNRYYNWVACCMMHYLRHRLEYTIPEEALEKRRLRQQMGESFLEWASLVFDTEKDADGSPVGIYLNIKAERTWLYNKFLDQYPEEKRYTTNRIFKEKLQKFCEYTSLHFNPTTGGKRIKSNGKEYIIIGGRDFDASTMANAPIDSDDDFRRNQNTPF